MDPVDLDERLQAQQAAIASANANVKQAQAKQEYAQTQAQRYVQLLPPLRPCKRRSRRHQAARAGTGQLRPKSRPTRTRPH